MMLQVLLYAAIVMTNHIVRGDDNIFNETAAPSFSPSSLPSFSPSAVPSFSPSAVPSAAPSATPSQSMAPSQAPRYNCTICVNGTKPNDLTAKYSVPSEQLTCGMAYERGPILLTEESCTNYQSIGRNLCYCEDELPVPTDCRLCEDENTSLPVPTLAASIEGDEIKSCVVLGVDARRDSEEACPAYQAIFGNYCGCTNTGGIVGSTCQICGANQTLDFLNTTLKADGVTNVSCGRLVFEASLPSADGLCDTYASNYSEYCCRDDPPSDNNSESDSDDPSGASVHVYLTSFSYAALGAFWCIASMV
mmetsp:Transcript_5730/g.7505  ORF Transcript_5730/g.7505 Transcript_5730/m.7505 type:complete len:306 (+) Transcript_5730:215-1132(+)